jgi:hypothetical protein
MMKEADLLKLILDWLALHRIFHWRCNTGAFAGEYKGKRRFIRFGVQGVPDIIGCFRGRMFGIECKAQGNDQSQKQRIFQSDLESAGGLYVLAYALEDVTERLR